jgi:hypothetical protein
VATVEDITARPDTEGRMLGEDQADALTKVAVSGRVLDVLVGPAGRARPHVSLQSGRSVA